MDVSRRRGGANAPRSRRGTFWPCEAGIGWVMIEDLPDATHLAPRAASCGAPRAMRTSVAACPRTVGYAAYCFNSAPTFASGKYA